MMPVKPSGIRPGYVLAAICTLLFSTLLFAQSPKQKPNYSPPEGLVPNRDTAIKIAEVVLTPIYGADVVEHEKPFRVELVNGVWVVDGALHHGPGGNLHIEISKKDCRIVRVIGTQ